MVKQQKDIAVLVDEFARHVANATDSTWDGDATTANRHTRSYITTFKKLRAMGNQGRDALAALFQHHRPDVRVAAAAFLLRHRTTEAIATLRELAQGKGMIAFQASEALKRWEESTWALDPPDEI